jgi:hypothetical protein
MQEHIMHHTLHLSWKLQDLKMSHTDLHKHLLFVLEMPQYRGIGSCVGQVEQLPNQYSDHYLSSWADSSSSSSIEASSILILILLAIVHACCHSLIPSLSFSFTFTLH